MDAYCTVRGLPQPPRDLNVWLSSAITAEASAPMLRRIAYTSFVSQALDWFLAGTAQYQVLALKHVLQRQLPDITMRYENSQAGPRRALHAGGE
jgi:hypothetical protein